MPSGTIPTYAYRPAPHPGKQPHLRSCSSLRSRLFAGGTYFRARDPGMQGNLFSVEVIEYTDTSEAVCVISNYGIKVDEMITGPATMDVYDIQFNTNEKVTIDQLDQPTQRARKYSISFKIAPPPDVPQELGQIRAGSLISLPGVLAAKLTPTSPVYTPSDVITIARRHRVYRLEAIAPIDPVSGLPVPGWDIENLRTQVNADNPWVEMLPRSGNMPGLNPGDLSIPNPNPSDVQDKGIDALVLTPFAEVRMSGGDGLPDNPDREVDGPFRSLVHVNYGEAHNGALHEINIVYEWNGSSSREGAWVAY